MVGNVVPVAVAANELVGLLSTKWCCPSSPAMEDVAAELEDDEGCSLCLLNVFLVDGRLSDSALSPFLDRFLKRLGF